MTENAEASITEIHGPLRPSGNGNPPQYSLPVEPRRRFRVIDAFIGPSLQLGRHHVVEEKQHVPVLKQEKEDFGHCTVEKLIELTFVAEIVIVINAQDPEPDFYDYRRSRPTPVEPEMKKSAEKLHDQLQGANRTVGELSDHAGMRSSPSKDDQT